MTIFINCIIPPNEIVIAIQKKKQSGKYFLKISLT